MHLLIKCYLHKENKLKKKIGLKELKVESFVTMLENNKLHTAQGGSLTIVTGNDGCGGGPTRGIILCTGT